MKKLLIILLSLSISLGIQAQEQNKKLSRAEKKALKKKKQEETAKKTHALLDARQFVFEASQVQNREGVTIPVNSNINFVIVDSNTVVFQTGTNIGNLGANGTGGITLEGKITDYQVDRNEKNKYTYIVIRASTMAGNFEIRMDISPSGNATVRLMKLGGKKLIYSGSINSFEDSRIYQGITY
jgi:ATPase subunit of ABC transporter with duplicated ATPase domains